MYREDKSIRESNHAMSVVTWVLLENCIFYILFLYEFLHSLGHQQPPRGFFVRFFQERTRCRPSFNGASHAARNAAFAQSRLGEMPPLGPSVGARDPGIIQRQSSSLPIMR
jgi:hypothetical protein